MHRSSSRQILRRTAWVLGVLVLQGSALAEPESRRSTFALGDCGDVQLRTAARVFHAALVERTPRSPQTMGDVVRSLRPQATKSLDELRRQLESAETQFYNASYPAASQQVREALDELERSEPGPARWEMTIQAHLLEALIARGTSRMAEAEEASRRVLRLQPEYQLDRDFFSPTVTAFFNRVRKQVAGAPKARLVVTSSPPGADVYLDGRLVGRTPFTSQYLAGAYQLQLDRQGSWSFPRTIQLSAGRDAVATVDLSFEGSVVAGEPLCLVHKANTGDPFKNAVKLGALIGVDEVVVLRQQKKAAGAGWVTASLLNVQGGQTVREGSLQTSEFGDMGASGGELVNFVVTGQASGAVRPPPPEARSTQAPSLLPPPIRPVLARPGLNPSASASPNIHLRWSSYVVAGLTAGSLATAGYLRWSARDDITVLEARGGPQHALRSDDVEGAKLYSELQQRGRLITGLLAGSGVGALLGASLFYFSRPSQPSVRLDIHAGSTGASVQLRSGF